MNFIISLIVGGLLGWVVSMFTGTNRRQGMLLNVVVGIVGVALGGWLLNGLLGSSMLERGEFSLSGLLVSLLGALILLTAVQLSAYPWASGRLHIDYLIAILTRVPATKVRHPMSDTQTIPDCARGRAAGGMLMLFAAFASAPPAPDSALDAAKVAILNAEKAEAGQFAGAELGEAREKLAMADGAVKEENMVVAERFAQESRVQAELASARTAAAKAVAVNDEMARGAEALSEEMQRAGEPR